MKYFTNWFVYTIKVGIPIYRLIYIFLHIDPIFVVSLKVSTARIFIVCPAIRQSQLLSLFISIALQINNRRSAFNVPIIKLHLYSLHLFSHQRC